MNFPDIESESMYRVKKTYGKQPLVKVHDPLYSNIMVSA